jgi:transcriptional regulator with XRE-family HTH domain
VDIERVIADNVRARRVALGWRQVDLAERMGISLSYACDLENNRRNIGVRTLVALAAGLGCEPGDLLVEPRGGEGDDA